MDQSLWRMDRISQLDRLVHHLTVRSIGSVSCLGLSNNQVCNKYAAYFKYISSYLEIMLCLLVCLTNFEKFKLLVKAAIIIEHPKKMEKKGKKAALAFYLHCYFHANMHRTHSIWSHCCCCCCFYLFIYL